ncbi:FMN-binding protein [Butyrivibrio sp. INlla14]|uniref:FMN-binding protein n=1 Tax=Butyrivibrio sp. INlla14 TaxID=1520808 RepID=UPI0008763D7A|nr:FMN-binding protein [Butyrivibrio sp. INlla14]SCX96366.1 FMN-binding domain-containing protein [Butyrivibrio sp. INlla14]
MSGEHLDLRDAQKKSADYFKDFDAICYGGWAMAGNLVKGNTVEVDAVSGATMSSEVIKDAVRDALRSGL